MFCALPALRPGRRCWDFIAAAAQLGHATHPRSSNGAAISQRAAMSRIVRGDGGPTRVDVSS